MIGEPKVIGCFAIVVSIHDFGGAYVLEITNEPRLDMLGGFIEAIPEPGPLSALQNSARVGSVEEFTAFNTKLSTTIGKRRQGTQWIQYQEERSRNGCTHEAARQYLGDGVWQTASFAHEATSLAFPSWPLIVPVAGGETIHGPKEGLRGRVGCDASSVSIASYTGGSNP